MKLIYLHHFYRKAKRKMINDNIICLNDIKIYSNELLEYIQDNFFINDSLEEIIIYFKASISEIDNINSYISELQSEINELERNF